ncbi:hypothetical protein, partial [Neptuniibacter sp.]|uniref:hypothetical protein n=1 Tax=Neptuniibacter sp. TaxID=1962643 RepID=UPI002626EAA9
TTLTSQRTASYLAYQDGWFIGLVPDTASALCTTDPTSWGGAPDIAAEGDPDFLVAAISNYKHVHLLGTKTIEVLYITGSASLPFARISGGLISTGCIAKDSVVNMNDQIYFLDDDFNVRRINGLQAEILSTPAIQYQISQLTDQQEAVAYSYSIEGHYVYVITFDQSGVTYCFDSTMKLWYKWSTGGYNNRHTSNCFIRYAGKNLVGDYTNGIIYEIDPASTGAGYLSKELINKMIVGFKRIGRTLTDLYIAPEDAADIREWTDTDIDPVTRREIFQAGGMGSLWNVQMHEMQHLGATGLYNINGDAAEYGKFMTSGGSY